MSTLKSGINLPAVSLLDGGFSSQLSRHIHDDIRVDGDPLWSARFLHTNPEAVVKTHLDFLRAGSDIILTNTYQASIEGFIKYLHLSSEESYDLIRRAVVLAMRARDIYISECQQNLLGGTRKIAGSVGPYGAYLHDGSEYNGSYADKTSVQVMRDWHLPRIETLVEAGVDFLAFETIPCLKEAEMLVELLKRFPNTKAWLSFSCKDDKTLAHGEDFKEALVKCWDANPQQLIAVGVNCCSPKLVAKLFKDIKVDRERNPIPFVTYPNSGENYNSEVGWVDREKCEALASFVPEWLDLGVNYIGGCCRTYAEDVANMYTEVQTWLNSHQ